MLPGLPMTFFNLYSAGAFFIGGIGQVVLYGELCNYTSLERISEMESTNDHVLEVFSDFI
jgi:hypothetical protein